MRAVDLGGDLRAWRLAPVRPRELVLLNQFEQPADDPGVRTLVGDACALPDALRGERFDLVSSNSVLEHVGGHARREAFAASVHALGESHWIQTPYRYFPVEPRWLFPGFQFPPARARASVTMRWPPGQLRRPGGHPCRGGGLGSGYGADLRDGAAALLPRIDDLARAGAGCDEVARRRDRVITARRRRARPSSSSRRRR
jgi:hypothetical protein